MAVRDQRPVALTNALGVIEARYAKQQTSVIEGGLFARFCTASKKPQSEAAIPSRGNNECGHADEQASTRRDKCAGEGKQDRRQLLSLKPAAPNRPTNCGYSEKGKKTN